MTSSLLDIFKAVGISGAVGAGLLYVMFRYGGPTEPLVIPRNVVSKELVLESRLKVSQQSLQYDNINLSHISYDSECNLMQHDDSELRNYAFEGEVVKLETPLIIIDPETGEIKTFYPKRASCDELRRYKEDMARYFRLFSGKDDAQVYNDYSDYLINKKQCK